MPGSPSNSSAQSFLGLGPTADVVFYLEGSDERKMAEIRGEKGTQRLPMYEGTEPVKGSVTASVKGSQKIEHQGIKVELIGEIGTSASPAPLRLSRVPSFRSFPLELIYDRGNHHDFVSVVQELSPPGILTGENKWDFDFVSAEKQFESYNGLNVRLRCDLFLLNFFCAHGRVATTSSSLLCASSPRTSLRSASSG